MGKTIDELIKEYFEAHPNQELKHGPVVDHVTRIYLEDHETPPRDPWRAIRKLYQDGFLQKIDKGVYKYDPEAVHQRNLEDFTAKQKERIFRRDGYKCVICGKGRADGVEITADHIKPKDLGGRAEVENGQTLCTKHNLRKKRYGQTETGKKLFIRLYDLAVSAGDVELAGFCRDVLDQYEKHGVNDHIKWRQ